MKVHFSMLADFKKELLEDPNFGSDGKLFSSSQTKKILGSEEKKLKITNLFIHTADLSGPAKEIKIAAKWTAVVNQEFTAQVIIIFTIISHPKKSTRQRLKRISQ